MLLVSLWNGLDVEISQPRNHVFYSCRILEGFNYEFLVTTYLDASK